MVTMFALLLALGTKPCLPAELGKIDPPSAIQVQAEAPGQPPPPPPPQLGPPPPPPPPPAPKAAARPAPPPALALEERAQYRINFGLLGQLGELNLNLTPGEQGDMVRLLGQVK